MKMSKTIQVPVGTDVGEVVKLYAALLNANGIPNNLPTGEAKVTNAIQEFQDILVSEFTAFSNELTGIKNSYDVSDVKAMTDNLSITFLIEAVERYGA